MIDAGIGANSASGSYDIENSLKFEADNTEYLTRTPSSDSNRKTFTTSLWVKRCELGSYQTLYGAQPSGGYSDANTFQFCFTPDDKLGLGLQTYWVFQTNRVFRDTSAWYHIVVRADTTQPFSHNRIRVYINGVQDTSFSTNALASIAEDQLLGVNHTTRQQIGSLIANSWHSSNYIADVNLIDGQSHAPSYFGEFDQDSGIWKPKKYTGTYGTNGFYLNFENSSDLGEDQSGNNNDWTLNNLTAADQATDTPTNNFCTMNILDRTNGNSKNQEGATKVTTDGGSGWCTMMATMGVTRGKWYWEYFKRSDGGSNIYFGIAASDDPYVPYSSAAQYYIGNVAEQTSIGFKVSDNTIANSNNSSAFALLGNEVLRVALDMDNGALYFGKSTSTWASSGDPTSGASKTGASSLWPSFDDKIVLPGISIYQGGIAQANFGGYSSNAISSPASDANGYGTFEYAPPTGYYALCTKNLAEFG
jgi:hypothetical protein